MSHGKIYQLATKPIDRDDYVSPDNYYDNCDSYADYIGDRVEGEERDDAVGYLADTLKDLVAPAGRDTFVYKGAGEFLQNWVDALHEKAMAITVDNILEYQPRATLRDIASGTHKDPADRFVVEENTGVFAEPMAELVEFMIHNMKPGDMLYVGAVIDFHY